MRRLLNILPIVLGLGVVACEGTDRNRSQERDGHYLTYRVELCDRTLMSEYSASIKGIQTVEVRPQVSGQITEIRIDEGATVRKGEILFVIDQLPYQIAYDIASANVKSAEAVCSTMQLALESNEKLYERRVVSEFELKTAQNSLVDAEAKLALARAEEVNARNNLSYTEVKSPVNGIASMIPYRVGALVNSNITEPLVTVSDDSNVYAYFSMTENQMLDLIQEYGSLQQAVEEMPQVELRMSNGEIYSQKGRIDAISGTITENTGAVNLRAVFPNESHLLRNGGSGEVLIPTTYKDCMVIPQTATYEMQDKVFVYKVVDGKAVSAEIVVKPQNNGTEYIVTSGLEEGDVIIAEGAGLVREGETVEVETDK